MQGGVLAVCGFLGFVVVDEVDVRQSIVGVCSNAILVRKPQRW
jgi:hypothetical protein